MALAMSEKRTREWGALQAFASAVRRAYGERLVGVYLFGSHARGAAHADSDVDVAVIIDRFSDKSVERRTLSDLAYDIVAETAVELQPWVVSRAEWAVPETHANPQLIKNMKRDGVPIRTSDDHSLAGQSGYGR